jgi:nucleotide-binding universal stress UspA family protein
MMNAKFRSEENEIVKNILVALDASEHSDAALSAAMSLARTLKANVKGMFVRDETWQQVTKLPSISAVNITTGELLTLKHETMETRVTILQNRLRERMEVLGKLNRVNHTWEFTEGNVNEKILEAAVRADLITIGQKGQSVSKKPIGSTAEAVIRKTEKPVLVIREGRKLKGPVILFYDGSEASEKGIKMAIRMARQNDAKLIIRVDPDLPQKDKGYLSRLHQRLNSQNAVAEIKKMEGSSAALFLQITHDNHAGMLILPKRHKVIEESLETFLSHLHCPVLLMS